MRIHRDYFYIAGLALLFFVPFLGSIHLFDWNETGIAESAREMLVTGNYLMPQMDFKPLWDSPPLFLWMQALSMHLFGVNEFAARFPNALCGMATMLLAFRIGLRLHDRLFGWLWALAWLGSMLPHLYFRSGLIDPWFNLLLFAGLYGFIEFRWQFLTLQNPVGFWPRYKYLVLGGLMLGLAILTKGFVAYLIAFLVLMLYQAKYKFRNKGFNWHLFLYTLTALGVTGLWLGMEIWQYGAGSAREFALAQWRQLIHPEINLLSHALVLLLGSFPASVLAIPNLWGDRQGPDEMLESDTLSACLRSDFATWMQFLFWVTLLLFSIIPTRIVPFASLAYFPLTYLGSLTLWRMVRWEVRPRVVGWLLPVAGGLIGLAAAAAPWIGMQPEILLRWTGNDSFLEEALRAAAPWALWQMIPGILLAGASLWAWRLWTNNNGWKTAQILFASTAAFVSMAIIPFARTLEMHTQHAAIEFYEEKAAEDCLVTPVGFQSHAHLFYTQKPAACNARTVYLVTRVDASGYPPREDCKELYRKNGYVFFQKNQSDGGPGLK